MKIVKKQKLIVVKPINDSQIIPVMHRKLPVRPFDIKYCEEDGMCGIEASRERFKFL
jgi:hypothetical protein